MMAKDLGKEDDYNYFIEKSKIFTNVFDPSTSLMRPKKMEGGSNLLIVFGKRQLYRS
jgi:putative alpha-1,2-mannosidase